MKPGEEHNMLIPGPNQMNNFVDFTPLSDDGATTQMGDPAMGARSDVLSNESPIKTNPMYLNME